MWYRNLGSPYRSTNGEMVDQDALFEPTERDLERMHRRKLLGVRFVQVPADGTVAPPRLALVGGHGRSGTAGAATTAPSGNDGAESPEEMDEELRDGGDDEDAPLTDAGGEEAEGLAEWPLRMQPRKYLQLHPDGQHADLARRYVAQEGADGVDD